MRPVSVWGREAYRIDDDDDDRPKMGWTMKISNGRSLKV